ncbi:MAG: acyltransferase family protein [Candidatus Komeilibacteria bacterium]|nr:acyltransferase family protein [Candidatus Komeilibacteria bacterium]
MQIYINNPVSTTWIFTVILVAGLAISARFKTGSDLFPLALTQELKGLAILGIVFAHLGYFLAADHRFLFPLSIFAGIGVDLFLFLSGYGITASTLKKRPSIIKFYRAGLVKLFTPFWLSLFLFLALDFFIFKIVYPWSFIGHALAGFFPTANLYQDLNSPLWYFTLILFYYLLFPMVFCKKYPWLAATVLYFIGFYLTRFNPAWFSNVQQLYQAHFIAFPLGVFIAWLFSKPVFLAKANLTKALNIKWLKQIGYYLMVLALVAIIGYTAYYSGVGKGPVLEQRFSLITMAAIVVLFLFKKIEFRLFYWLGFYSYEIYLLHWPILYRYDLLYKYLPWPWLATAIYLAVFLVLGIGLKKLSDIIVKKFQRLSF